MRRWVLRVVCILLAVLALALLGGFTYEQVGRSRDPSNLPPRIGEAVNIGGRTLNLYCSGNGTPTVIFETGGNEPGYSERSLQSRIAVLTRACWYDRAGVGWSDPPPSPRTSAAVINDLHEMLLRAGVSPPYVLVGASIGGEYARIYTAQHPKDVAGLVLIDSAVPDQHEPSFLQSPLNRLSGRTRHLICIALPPMVRFGIIRFVVSTQRRAPDTEEAKILSALDAQPKAFETDAEQACAATDQGRIVPRIGTGNPDIDGRARKAGSLGDRPLVVLTAGRYWAPSGFEKEAAEYHEIWVHQLQASLAHLSTRGRQIVVDAGHGMEESPDSIVIAVEQVVDEVRTNSVASEIVLEPRRPL